MESNDEKYMKAALGEARAAAEDDEVPVGAVIVCRDRIIGRGHNMTEKLHDATAHAEMIAITSATETLGGKYLDDCTLYVTVAMTRNGDIPFTRLHCCIPRPKS